MFRLYTYLILFCVILIGCTDEGNVDQTTGEIRLEVKASVEHKSNGTKTVISETNFPASVSGETSEIGLFLMNDKGQPYKKYEDNLLAVLKGYILPDKSVDYVWSYKLNDGVTPLDHLSVLPEADFQLYGYYPRVKNASSSAVPFDLANAVNEEAQTDILFSPVSRFKANKLVQTQFINLSFRHLFALIEFQIKVQTGQQNMQIREVRIENRGSAQWIKNKGYFNPQTGIVTATSYGPVSILCDKALTENAGSFVTIQMLVPPFVNWDYINGDVQVSFFSERGQINPTAQLLLTSGQVTSAGFESGKKYTYKLSYNNNLFRIEDWFVNGEVTDDSIGK